MAVEVTLFVEGDRENAVNLVFEIEPRLGEFVNWTNEPHESAFRQVVSVWHTRGASGVWEYVVALGAPLAA